MDLICYAASSYPDQSTLLARLQAEMPVACIQLFQTPEELRSGLLRPTGNVLAVVLFPADQPDLAGLLTLQDLMAGTRIILILPLWNPQLLAEAHSLRPRFLTCRGKDFGEVGAVLRKMAASFSCAGSCSPEKEEGNGARGKKRSEQH